MAVYENEEYGEQPFSPESESDCKLGDTVKMYRHDGYELRMREIEVISNQGNVKYLIINIFL